jgi:hypothetical protein
MPETAHLMQFPELAICYLRAVVSLWGRHLRPMPELDPQIPT